MANVRISNGFGVVRVVTEEEAVDLYMDANFKALLSGIELQETRSGGNEGTRSILLSDDYGQWLLFEETEEPTDDDLSE